jgi:hypothetical protein
MSKKLRTSVTGLTQKPDGAVSNLFVGVNEHGCIEMLVTLSMDGDVENEFANLVGAGVDQVAVYLEEIGLSFFNTVTLVFTANWSMRSSRKSAARKGDASPTVSAPGGPLDL